MKNIPRIFVNEKIESGKKILIEKDISHYLKNVMRTENCLVFNDGNEFSAKLSDDSKFLVPELKTEHRDPSNDIIFYFAPIKKTDEMLNMVTQMGVAKLQPVITDRTVAHHINWKRVEKIITEASEQSNRNSVPKLLSPIKFSDLDKESLVFADERSVFGKNCISDYNNISAILIGPEGGFSDSEFNALDNAGAVGISLGKTILRAETAAVTALAKIIK
ncbi:MAG: 16S rRNA (uracil(1498)-N(3))-methyltransferase [Alphaproteobacteria bacterium]|nr:16S rRNA (uracil(1498)-N(3))-methyltransferase [Alphaproteobacteria bacterium]MBN2675295.1 16S rRNA (uracil(1498)-N(3))-methyltransferase [Alphaproteobacteria bacterium]